MKQELFDQSTTYMNSLMRDSVYDIAHVGRVLGFALQIAQQHPCNMDVLIFSCVLHDIARPQESENPKLCHAKVGSQMAYDFLTQLGVDAAICQQVKACIASHRYKGGDMPNSIEAKILFDADKLDLTGSMGCTRAIQFGTQIGQPVYRLDSSGRSVASRRDENTLMNEYIRKLCHLQDMFFTETASRMAFQNQHTMDTFFNSLLQEIERNARHKDNLLKKYIEK